MPHQAFLESREDMQWLRDVHLPGLPTKFRFAIIHGNEDSPTKIEVYEKNDVNSPCVTYAPNEDGKYHVILKGTRVIGSPRRKPTLTKPYMALAKKYKLTPSTVSLLFDLGHLSHGSEPWWHDLPPAGREQAHKLGLLQDSKGIRVPCNAPGHRHPGYVVLSPKGAALLKKMEAILYASRGHSPRTEPRGPRRGHGQRTLYWTEHGRDLQVFAKGPGATEWARAHHDLLGESWDYGKANGDYAFVILHNEAKNIPAILKEIKQEYPNVRLQYIGGGDYIPRQWLERGAQPESSPRRGRKPNALGHLVHKGVTKVTRLFTGKKR